jgi:hypothetical protein
MAFASIEYSVYLGSVAEPWVSTKIASFPGAEGEKAAYAFAAEIGTFDGTTTYVACSQTL